MTLQALINLIRQDGGSWVIIMVVIMTLVQIAPVKIDPWSSIFTWFGNQFNKDLYTKIDDLKTQFDNLEAKFDKHILDSNEQDTRLRRETIMDFGNSCMNGRKHTKEEFDFIISECDKYEKYCDDNNIPNGVADATMQEIKRIYAKCLRENSFLIGGVIREK